MLLVKCPFIFQAVSEEKIFLTLANQKQELPLAPYLLAEWDEMKKIYREPEMKL
jgi:hypothetical protein